MIHTLWHDRILIEDDLLDPQGWSNFRDWVGVEFGRRQTKPIMSIDHLNLPPELGYYAAMLDGAVTNYCEACGIDYAMDIVNLQATWVENYNETSHHEFVHEPHHDLSEGGYLVAVYYVCTDVNSLTRFVGGDLAIYKALTYSEYPEGMVHVRAIPNRLVVFPAMLYHRIKPYFGRSPRIALSAVLSKSADTVQNKRVCTL